jgi:RNA polymerase sigma factor (sigma-70 family)
MQEDAQAYIVVGAMPLEIPDEEIVRRALLQTDAFALIIERYEAKLLRYLERLGVGVKEDREDVLQNAFIKAYKNLNSFDLSLPFSSWMYRIAHNEAMSFFRSKRARPQIILSEEGEGLITELADERFRRLRARRAPALARGAREGLRDHCPAVPRRADAALLRESLLHRDV